jgi:FtsP/CotA-like multicopper oxidase with cupredoxin domain
MDRRNFLKSFLTLGALGVAGEEVMAGEEHTMHGMIPGSEGSNEMKTGESFSWADPDIPISSPPSLMNRQMGRVHTLNVPPLGYEMEGHVKVFTLIAQPVSRFLTDGRMPDQSFIQEPYRFKGGMHHNLPREAKLWGYNGHVPGPTIEAIEGERIRVILKNELPEPTSIHWHGLEVPNGQDGAGGHTEAPTPPGGSHVYEFQLNQTGTFMYHTGFNVMKQDGMGLGGFVVIHPKEYKKRIDKDVAIMLQSFALLPGNDRANLVTMDFNWFTFTRPCMESGRNGGWANTGQGSMAWINGEYSTGYNPGCGVCCLESRCLETPLSQAPPYHEWPCRHTDGNNAPWGNVHLCQRTFRRG